MFVGCTKELVDDSANQVGPEVENPEVTPDEEPVVNTTVTIDLPSDEAAVVPSGISVKTTLGALEDGVRKIYWCDDDKISINGNASTLMTKMSDDKRSATFEFADAVLEYPYSVLYPAEMYKDEQTITLLAVQPSADDSFADDAAPMAAYQAEAGKIALKHLVGVVRLQIKLPAESTHGEHTLNRVEFRGNNSEQVSGDFTINYTDATIASVSTAEADQKVVAMVEKTLSSESNTDVFIVVPAMQYAQGFTVRLVDDAGHFMDISTEDITIAAGEVKRMPVVEFVPKGTLVDVEIKSAADLVAFAKAYNAGEYSQTENLKVVVKNDIIFDDETNAAEWTIGQSGNWFKGTFDGGDYSIKNMITSRPVFYGVDATGLVKNLNIDASCILTADFTDNNQYYGAFVGYQHGQLESCCNNADINVTGKWGSSDNAIDVNVGGLIGRIASSGKAKACSMNGNVTTATGFSAVSNIYMGGISGCIAASEGEIQDSHFNGSLTINGGSTGSSKTAYVGGITGLSGGKVERCATKADKEVVAVRESNNVANFYLGGIVGKVKVGGNITDCTNNSFVHFKYPRGSAGTKRYAYVGGVAGGIEGVAYLEKCSNNSTVQSSSAYRYIYIGGVVGDVAAESSVSDCVNNSSAIVTTKDYGSDQNGAEELYMGGVIGRCASSNISGITNDGTVDMNYVQSADGVIVNTGGCIGYLTASIDGMNKIQNSGLVTATDAAEKRKYLALGGVVGCINKAGVTLSNVTNIGDVTNAVSVRQSHAFTGGVVGLVRQSAVVNKVTNKGTIHFSNTTGSSQLHVNVGLGGVVGGVSALPDDDFAVTVSNSVNDGEVSRVATAAAQKSSSVCGGIVGILKGTGSLVSECTNTGLVKNEALNSTTYDDSFDPLASDGSGQAAGGIVGFVLGASADAVMVSNCTNSGECYTARGYVGGVVGYARSAKLSGCRHKTALVSGAASYSRVGGVTGHISAAAITDCHVENATLDGMSQGNTGGISGGMTSAASATNATVSATIQNSVSSGRAGAIVGYSLAGVTITDCGAKGMIGKASTLAEITTANFDGNNKATISGSYILQ